MPLVFKTHSDSTERTDIVGAGVLFPYAKGGVVVSEAANVLPELQEKNPDGSLKLDADGNAIPLTGSKLTAAAKEFADSRGFTTVNASERDIDTLAEEVGVAADPVDAIEAAKADYARTYGDGLETVNNDPEALVNPEPGDGVPIVPDTTDHNPTQED
jgi:hypothetical protein